MITGSIEWEDKSVYFDTEFFGVNATLVMKNTDQPNIHIKGIFDTPYAQRDLGAFIVDAEDPSFTCEWHDGFEHARKGDILRIAEGDKIQEFYIDTAAQNDGTAIVSFKLTPKSSQDASGDEAIDSIDLDGTDGTPLDNSDPLPTGGLFSHNPKVR